MTEVAPRINDVFRSPEFGSAFTVWQYARLTTGYSEDALARHVAAGYEGPDTSQHDIDVHVSYVLEMPPDTFADVYDYDPLALRLRALQAEGEAKEAEAKETVLNAGEEQGLSKFAMYGLWLHMRESGFVLKSELRGKVTQAEADFDEFDKYIRANPGRLLTTLRLGSYAGRLGTGGIEIRGYDHVYVPVEGPVYSMSFTRDMEEVYESERMTFHPSEIHSILGSARAKLLDSWNDLLRIDEAYELGEGTFAVGDVVEGPPYIVREREQDREFFQLVFDRTRAVSRMALDNS